MTTTSTSLTGGGTTDAAGASSGTPTTGAAGDKGGTGDKGAAGATQGAQGAGLTGTGQPGAGAATTQQGDAQTKDGQGAAGELAKGAAADIELKLPEGVTADAGLMDGFRAWAKENNLKSESAQKVVDLFSKVSAERDQKAQQLWTEQQEGWKKSAQSDKEYGGEKFPANLETARKALNALGTPELRQLLDDSGLTNHPELIRLFHRVGTRIAEDRVAGTNGTGASAGIGGEETLHRQLYPSMFKEQ